jgi:hypothetical protein
LTHIAAADGIVGPTHDWQACCVCGWSSHAWPTSRDAAAEHGAHRLAMQLPKSA